VAGLYRLPLGSKGQGDETAPCSRACAFLYVNRGLGTFGLPMRLGVPPEITVLTLRSAGRAFHTLTVYSSSASRCAPGSP
jgi:hypothetical protein